MIRRPRPEDSMLPVEKALIGSLALSGVVGFDVLSAVESSPVGSALHGRKVSGVRVLTGFGGPRLCDSLLWPLLTSRGISSSGSPQVRTRCFPARPPHLPPRLVPSTSLCCASSSHRVGLAMRFLFIGPPVSSSLPPPGWLPFRGWLQVIVHLHIGSPTGDLRPVCNAPMLGAHKPLNGTAPKLAAR